MCNMNKILEKAKELVAMLEETERKDKVKLSTVKPGGVIELGEDEFVVLDHDEGGTLVISKEFMAEDVKFGDNTDFNGSNVRRVLYEDILPKIEEVVGAENILPQTVKLTTVDNQNVYEDVTERIRLLTFNEARKYNLLIANEDLCDYWWLMNPWTSRDRWEYPVSVVSPDGGFGNWYFSNGYGVRPVLYLKSNIFVSLGGKCDENKLEQKVDELERKLNDGLNELKVIKAKLEKKKYAGSKIGDTFELIGKKWKILDSNENGALCLCLNSLGDKEFDCSCNEWTSSNLRDYLNTEVYKKICEEIGSENVIESERDLLSIDGQTEYGTCKDFVSLISIDEYRKYRSMIPNFEEWWWTLTPYSTKCNNSARMLAVVSPVGDFSRWSYDFSCGVRPVCIFSSTLFESEDD